MPHIAPISWQDFERFLLAVGCAFKRQEGSHRIYAKAGIKRPIVVPQRNALPVFVIRNNLRTLGIAPKDYEKILKE